MGNTTKLIVLMAFDRDAETGELIPAWDAREMPNEERAKQDAALQSVRHTGVIAWSRDAEPDLGEYGPPTILACYGEVPEME